MSYNPDYVN